MTGTTEWFGEWFNSPYYHILYKNRDANEAETFLKKLSAELCFTPEQYLLDLACGKGRHSIYLNKQGYRVLGVDLASESIEKAKKFENERLKFKVHDMRKPLQVEHFDVILNLFTSFGYFESEAENEQAIKAMSEALKPKGLLVIDFMNAIKVANNLVPKEQKEVDGLIFNITREIKDGYIYKHIKFEAENHNYTFTEKVQALSKDHFLNYLRFAGLDLIDCFGNYDLQAFDELNSDRLILIVRKP